MPSLLPLHMVLLNRFDPGAAVKCCDVKAHTVDVHSELSANALSCTHRRIDDTDTGEAAEELLQEHRRTQGRGEDRHDAQLGGEQLPAGNHRRAQLLQ